MDFQRLKPHLPWITLLVLVTIVGITDPGFLKPANLMSLAGDIVPLFIMALGLTFAIYIGGIDLSAQSPAAVAWGSVLAEMWDQTLRNCALLMQDDAQQAKLAETLMASLTESEPGYICREVMIELVWVLERAYDLRRDTVTIALNSLLETRELRIDAADFVAIVSHQTTTFFMR